MTTILEVDGMTCNGCVQNVTNLLNGIDGVTAVNVTLEPGRATVTHADATRAEQLIGCIEDAGYDAKLA